MLPRLLALLFLLNAGSALGAGQGQSQVAGRVVDSVNRDPVQLVEVSLKDSGAGVVQRDVTDAKGQFAFKHVGAGEYRVAYGVAGISERESPPFRVAGTPSDVDVGVLELGSEVVRMAQVAVAGRRELLYASLDRKVYHVGQDVQSVTGTVSDLLKNVPSVQVDIEGNVSLRGDPNVLMLIDGKSSAMMGRNRAAVLEQLPAEAIERIEVITNPSAKYRPDGTAGIINLVMKARQRPGHWGVLRGAVGNSGRYNVSASGHYNPGKYDIFGTIGLRQDDRPRWVQDDRGHADPGTGSAFFTSQRTTEQSRPRTRIAQAGAEHRLDEHTKTTASLNYDDRKVFRASTLSNLSRAMDGSVASDYVRARHSRETEDDIEFTGSVHHAFAEDDHELEAELRHGRSTEREDSDYVTSYRLPSARSTRDATRVRNMESETEGSIDYTRPAGDEAKLETGYSGQRTKVDLDFRGTAYDAVSQAWQPDMGRSNRFVFHQTVHAAYGTYGRKFGRVGIQAGVRLEDATVQTNQMTARETARPRHARAYPSLHLGYDLTETQQLKLSYSHRVRRPDGDELNPFPEYQDPFNLKAGNPRLSPEDTHAIEAGWQYRDDGTTYLVTGYVRHRYNSLTEVARYIDANTLLTTMENLGGSTSGGVEAGATARVFGRMSVNVSANAFWNEIDASNLGFSSRRSTIAAEGKLNASWDLSPATLVQFNTSYTSRRLTPQGYRHPVAVLHVGLKHTFADQKTAFVLTVSDVFSSLRERTTINTPVLRRDLVRRRVTRIIFAGFTYTFGQAAKKPKDDIQFDSSL